MYSVKINSCSRCDLYFGVRNIVSGEGSKNSIMFIGEAPGAKEDKLGKPFVGRAGKHLQQYFNLFNLTREEDFYITNIVKCRPTGNRKPTYSEQQLCKVYLTLEIKNVQPYIIVLLGSIACYAILGIEHVSSARGKWYGKNKNIIATYHPSYAMRNINMEYNSISLNKDVFDDFVKIQMKYKQIHPLHETNL